MDEYIGCRNCESPDCKGCNLKNLETMLNNGKFDCLMNENRCINPSADVAPVLHARWEVNELGYLECTHCGWVRYGIPLVEHYPYCPSCGCRCRNHRKENDYAKK